MSGSDLGHFPGAFWGVWVVVLTVAGLLWLAWLLFATYRARATKPADEVWDETLSEGDAAPPRWWFFMLLGFLFFTVAYLVVYPGLGQFRGVLRWTQFRNSMPGAIITTPNTPPPTRIAKTRRSPICKRIPRK